MSGRPTLRRRLSLPLITLYGLGTIVGAGIFVLIGEAAGKAGLYAPVSFGLASLLVAFTAFSFAELSSRYPKSAGEAIYVQECFGLKPLSLAVGLLVALAGDAAGSGAGRRCARPRPSGDLENRLIQTVTKNVRWYKSCRILK